MDTQEAINVIETQEEKVQVGEMGIPANYPDEMRPWRSVKFVPDILDKYMVKYSGHTAERATDPEHKNTIKVTDETGLITYHTIGEIWALIFDKRVSKTNQSEGGRGMSTKAPKEKKEKKEKTESATPKKVTYKPFIMDVLNASGGESTVTALVEKAGASGFFKVSGNALTSAIKYTLGKLKEEGKVVLNENEVKASA